MGPQIDLPIEGESKIELFQRREIRKTLHDDEWWFSVKDIVEAVTGAADGTSYVAGDVREMTRGTFARIAATGPPPTTTPKPPNQPRANFVTSAKRNVTITTVANAD